MNTERQDKDTTASMLYYYSRQDREEDKRNMKRIPVIVPTEVIRKLSIGEHNLLQKKIIEDFLPLWGMGAEVLYVGDSTNKYLHRDAEALQALHIQLEHEELPDVVAYSREKNLLFLIEAYFTSNPMNDVRVKRLKRLVEGCPATIVFVTAFLSKRDGLKHLAEIAWETEVWFANEPEHMMHLNGHKFLEIHR